MTKLKSTQDSNDKVYGSLNEWKADFLPNKVRMEQFDLIINGEGTKNRVQSGKNESSTNKANSSLLTL